MSTFSRKLDKRVVQRRLDLMSEEGVVFVNNAHGQSSSSLFSSATN
jgi:NADPH-dependent glutamate synthase beta subunit-like oxidoreductase